MLESARSSARRIPQQRLSLQIQTRHGNRQLKPAWSSTSRVDVEDAIALEFSRLMGVAADDDMESGGRGIQVESVQIVQNVEENPTRFRDRCFRQGARPIRLIYVSTNGNKGSEFSQRIENFRFADVTGVKNQLRTAKRFKGLRAQQPMSIRDQANSCRRRRRSLHEEILMLGSSAAK